MLYKNLKIEENDLPYLIEIDFNKHPKRYLKLRLIRVLVLFLILGSVATITFVSGVNVVPYIIGTACVVLCFWIVFTEVKAFPRRGYLIRNHDVNYRKGWLFRSVVSIPYNRIQHSEVVQGPISRAMKLSTLKVYTAGGSTSDLSISGLEPNEAERLREWITLQTAKHV